MIPKFIFFQKLSRLFLLSVTFSTFLTQSYAQGTGTYHAVATPAVVCSGGASSLNLVENIDNTATIQWQMETAGTFMDLAGATAVPYTTAAINTERKFRAIITISSVIDTSSVATVTVTSKPVGGTATATPTLVCVGNTATLKLTAQTGAIQWQESSSSTGPFSDINGATATPYTTGAINTTTYFQARLTSGSCTEAISTVATVTAVSGPTPGTVSPLSKTICAGEQVELTLSGNIGTIEWQSSASATGGFTSITSATGTTYITPVLATTTYYKAVVTLDACGTAETNTVAITVSPAPVAGTITATPNTICAGETSTLTLAGYTGTIQWQLKNSTGQYTDIPGATSVTYATGALTATSVYKAVLSNAGCTATAKTPVVAVTIHDKSQATSVTANPIDVCKKGKSTLTIATGYVGDVQWTKKILSGPNAGKYENLAGETNSTYQTPSLSEFATYRAKLKGACDTSFSNDITVAVSDSSVGGTTTISPNQICKGASVNLDVVNNDGSTIQWQKSPASPTNFQDIPGATTKAYTATAIATETVFRARVKNGLSCPGAYSTPAAVAITPDAIGGSTGAPISTICPGTSATLNLTGNSGDFIQWQDNSSGAFANISGANSATYTTAPLSVTTTFRAQVSNLGCTLKNSTETIITVKPGAKGGVLTASSTNICAGATTTLTISGHSGIDLKWQFKNNLGKFEDLFVASTPTYTTAALSTNATYRVKIWNDCDTAYSNELPINVVPLLMGGNATATPNSICAGSTTKLSLADQTDNATIHWQIADALGSFSNILGATGNNYTTNPLSKAEKFRAVVSNGSCPNAFSTDVAISIIPPSVVGTLSPLSSTICKNETITLNLNGPTTGTIKWQSATATGSFTDIVPLAANTSYTANSLSATTRFRAIVNNSSCKPDTSAIATVTVTPLSEAGTAKALATMLCTGSSTSISLTGAVGNIQWQQIIGGSVIDLPGATATSYYTPALTTQTIYRVAVTNGNCPAAYSDLVIINVVPLLSGGEVTTASAAICSGTATALILKKHAGSVQWQTNASGVYADIPGANDTIYTTPELTVATGYRVVVSSGTCPNATSTELTISIIPASIGGTAQASPSSVCSGYPSTITLSGYAGTIQWQQAAPSGIYTNITGATAATYTTPALTTAMNYRALVSNNGCTHNASAAALVTINPASKAETVTAASSTVCSGGTTTIKLTNYSGNIQWQTAEDGVPFTAIAGATGDVYTTPGLTKTTRYRAVVTNGNCFADTSNTVKVSIVPALIGGKAKATPSAICKGSTTKLSVTGYTGSSFQWQTFNLLPFGYKDIPGATDSTYITPALSFKTTYRVVISGSGCSEVNSTSVDVDIVSPSIGGEVTAAPSTVCSGEKTTVTLGGGYLGTIQWQTNASGNYLAIPGATLESYTTPALTAPTSYRAKVTNSGCSAATSTATLISISPLTVPGTATASATVICKGGNTTLTLTGYIGTIQWQVNTSGTAYTNISGATSATYATPALTQATNYRALVKNGNCPAVASNVIPITITPALTGGIATATPAAICKGTTTTIVLSGYSGSLQWQTDVSGSYQNIAGATTDTYITPKLSKTTNYQAVVSSTGCPSATSKAATVSVIEASLAGTAIAAPTSICGGETTTITLKGYMGSIQWQSNETGIFANISGATSNPYTTKALTKATSFRAVVINNSCAADTSAQVSVAVAPGSVGGTITATALTICTNATTKLNLTGYSGVIQWQQLIAGTYTNISGANGISYTTPALTTSATYRAFVKNGSCPASASADVTIQVTPTLTGGVATATPAVICNGTSSVITLTGHTGSVQWQLETAKTFVNISGATGLSYTTPALTATTTYRAFLSSGGCPPVTSQPATVSITPASVSGDIYTTTSKICFGESTVLKLSGHAGKIQWQIDSTGTYYTIPGATDTILTTGALTKSAAYRVIVVNGTCAADTSNALVVSILNPSKGGIPTAKAQTVCKGSSTTLTLQNFNGAIKWQTNASGNFLDIPGAINASYVTPALTTPTSYRAIVTTGNCPPALSDVVSISVTDKLVGGNASAAPAKICTGSTTTLSLIGYKGEIQWQTKNASKVFVDVSGATVNNYLTQPITDSATFRAKLTSGGCPAVFSDTIVINTTKNLNGGYVVASPSAICSGSTTELEVKDHTGNVQWQEELLGVFVNIVGANSNVYTTPKLTAPARYRAFISSGTCPSAASALIDITVINVNPPLGNTSQQFCTITNPTISQLIPSGPNINWYASNTGGAPLPLTTALINGATYYATQLGNGCESDLRLKVTTVVNNSATIISQSYNISSCPGKNVNFVIQAEGLNTIYQWMLNTGSGYVNLTDNATYQGSLRDTLKITNASTNMNGYLYRCLIKGNCTLNDSTVSIPAALIIAPATEITAQPTTVSVCYDESLILSTSAKGTALSYHWQVDEGTGFLDISDNSIYIGSQSPSLTIDSVKKSMINYRYQCAITNTVCGTTKLSDPATILYNDACEIDLITVPSGFSPNGDGVNDLFVIQGLEKFPGTHIQVYNTWGDLVYKSSDYKNDWGGTTTVANVGGIAKLPVGTYFIHIDLRTGSKIKMTYLEIKY